MHDKIFIYTISKKVFPMYLKRLKDLREDIDEKQITIAKFLGITRQQYSLYETGKRDIPAEYIRELATFYNTSTDYILELTNKLEPYDKN
jgi:transcriptional regulator with XRE-family HTH domain